jgi:hypothetical protein
MRLSFSPEELEKRKPVWIALSDLFLDTDVRMSYVHIACVLAESDYSLEGLYKILDKEVTPALQHNLLDVAGDWAGFPDDWVVETIINRKWSIMPKMVSLDPDWKVVSWLVWRLRSVQDPALRAHWASGLRILVRMFLHRNSVREGDAINLPWDTIQKLFHQELWPLLIDVCRERAASAPGVYPSEAEIVANWHTFGMMR